MTTVNSRISPIPIEKLVAHSDNPNHMSKRNLTKLVRNIERTGRYEPLVVRPCPHESGFFQIINGRHRRLALLELGYKTVDAVVWDVNDVEADILLATLNHLGGRNVLDKKLALLRRLSGRMQVRELAKLLPQSASQIERLSDLKVPKAPANTDAVSFANPLVFFVSDGQQEIIERALSLARQGRSEKTKAARNAAALTAIAERLTKGSR
ncbi:MAG: ParB/RepB/Spo0J family partition protein [Planctomycetota bacterium]